MMRKYITKKILRYAPRLVVGKLRNCIQIKSDEAKFYCFKIAEDSKELEDAYKLIHDQYVHSGYMDPCPSGMRLNLHNLLPETTTFIGKSNGHLLITITIFQDTELGLPMDNIYQDELDVLRREGRKVAEVGALASNPAFRNGNQNIPMHANKIMYQYAIKNLHIDDLVIAINPKHEWIYRHILLFEKIGNLKYYDYVKSAPALAYRLDLKKAQKRYREVYDGKPIEMNLYHFFVLEESENIELPEENKTCCIWDKQKVDHFFKQKTSLLEGADEETRKCLSRYCFYLN
jgi:hypothetical protein